jgi:hypothetical protein
MEYNKKNLRIRNFSDEELKPIIIDQIEKEISFDEIFYYLNWCSKKEMLKIAEIENFKISNKNHKSYREVMIELGYYFKHKNDEKRAKN